MAGVQPNALNEPLADVLDRVPADWAPLVSAWRASAPGRALVAHVHARQEAGVVIYPRRVLHALEMTPRKSVRVVILGQDPYHGAGQAEGLAFSVPPGVRLPPSLRNILAERDRDPAARLPLAVAAPDGAPPEAADGPSAPDGHGRVTGSGAAVSGHLGGWARQGVLLLNTALTVEEGRPASHAGKGWEALTDILVQAVAADPGRRIFMLWGAHAQAKAGLIEAAGAGRHAVLTANHPSPLSARRPPQPFIGCGHFAAANVFIRSHGGDSSAIDWWA